jgi:hypothetical protein
MQNISFDRFLAVAGFVLAIVSLVAAFIFYKKSLKTKEPIYIVSNFRLIQNNVPQMNGLKISYKDQIIENLSVSNIVFWNKGTETIDNQDIIKQDPLRIECSENNHILEATVIRSNKLANQLSLEVRDSGKAAYVTFEYLDKNNGGIFQIIHTGISSNDIFFKGELKGAVIQVYKNRQTNRALILFLPALLQFYFVVIVDKVFKNIFLSAGSRLGYSYNHSINLYFILYFIVVALSAFGLIKLADWLNGRNHLIPKQLRRFDM